MASVGRAVDGALPGAVARTDRGPRALGWLLLVSAVVRLAYFFDSHRLPFIDGPLFDSVVYLQQAAAVAAGDFGHPALLAFSPLYGYFLALAGGATIALQLGLGVANTYFAYRLGRDLSSATPGSATLGSATPGSAPPATDDTEAGAARARDGIAAGTLFVLYGQPLFYEGKLLSETLGLTLAFAAVVLAARARPRAALAGGALIGLATLARANLLFCLPFWPLAALAHGTRERRWQRAGAAAVGVAMVLCLNGAWNAHHTGRFVPVILVSQTVSHTAGEAHEGTLRTSDGSDQPASPMDVVRQAERVLAGEGAEGPAIPGIDLLGYLANAPTKALQTFRDVETSFQYGYYGERKELRSLAMLPLSFGGLLVLALWALMRSSAARRGSVPMLPLVLGVLATTTLFHPSTRYRFALVIPLVTLGGMGAVAAARELGDWLRHRRGDSVAGRGGAGAVGGSGPVPPHRDL